MSLHSHYCLAQHQELSWRSTPTCSRARWRPRNGEMRPIRQQTGHCRNPSASPWWSSS